MAYFFPFSSVVFTKQFIHVLTTLHDHPVLYILSSTISFGPTKSPCRMLTTALFYSGQASTIGNYGLSLENCRNQFGKEDKNYTCAWTREHSCTLSLSHTHTHSHTRFCLGVTEKKVDRAYFIWERIRKHCQIASNQKKLYVFKGRPTERTLTRNLWFQVQVFSLTLCYTLYDLPIQTWHGLCNI